MVNYRIEQLDFEHFAVKVCESEWQIFTRKEVEDVFYNIDLKLDTFPLDLKFIG